MSNVICFCALRLVSITTVHVDVGVCRICQLDALVGVSTKGPRRPTPFRLGSHGIFERVGVVLAQATLELHVVLDVTRAEFVAAFALTAKAFDDVFADCRVMVHGAEIGVGPSFVVCVFRMHILVCVDFLNLILIYPNI